MGVSVNGGNLPCFNLNLLSSVLQPAVVHLQGQGSAIQVKNGKHAKHSATTKTHSVSFLPSVKERNRIFPRFLILIFQKHISLI